MEGSQKVERSKKETATVDASKKKSALFDEEIGDDFLTSWKSGSVTNDALDFNCGTPPGRKKGFKFDKLDMDFGFDDGFDKISSFKLDMSDLDFSSPPRKSRMPMGTPGRHSNHGKQEKKSELFNLDFDFTNKVSFDLGASLPEGEKKSDNFVEAKAFDFSTESHQNKNSSCKLSASMDSTENTEAKVEPILDRGSSPKPDSLLESKLDAANDDSPSTSVNIGSQIVTQSVATPGKPVNGSSQENPRESHVGHEYSEHVLQKSNSKQYFEVPVQEISTQLVSSDDSLLGAAQEVQSGDIALERELNTAQGTELGNSNKEKIFKLSSPVRSSPPIKNSPRSSSKNCTFEIRENVPSDDPIQGDTEVEVTDVMAVQPMELRALKDIKQIQGSVPKAISPLHRLMNIGKPVSIKEKTMGTIHSPSLVNFGESEAALNLASIPKNSQPLCDGKINARHSSLPDLKRKKFKESNGKDGNPKTNILRSLKKPAMEGLHVALGNEEKDNGNLTSTLQVCPTSIPKQAATSKLKSMVSKIITPNAALVRSSKNVSVARSKLSPSNIGSKACDISSLKISRICDLSNFNVQKEKKPMRHRDLGSQMTDSVEKKNFVLPSPSLRKKTSEVILQESNAGSVILNPLKHVMESHSGNPNTSSKLLKVSPKSAEAKAVHRDENLHKLKSFSLDQMPSALYIPPDLCMTSLEVPSLIETNGNIEKAEACGKELEDICNMLKKKNEDAKELLARALVNNNMLLMLNHPVYEDKIQKIRKFITNMSKERHF